jgi:Peptidase U49
LLLDQQLKRKPIFLEFVDNPSKFAEYEVKTGIVRLGHPMLGALWAAAHAYIVAFHEYQQANRRGDLIFHVGKQPRVANAYALYAELLASAGTGLPTRWPSDDIRPIRYPFEHTDGHTANELFLAAVAWIVHHELAHARLDHEEAPVNSKLQENEADAAATRWICEDAVEAMPLQKRAMGMVTAVMFLVALDLRQNRHHSNTHPPSFERLMRNLEFTRLDEDDIA